MGSCGGQMNVTNEGLLRLHGKPSNYNDLEITNDEQEISNSEGVGSFCVIATQAESGTMALLLNRVISLSSAE
jgi:hypothetical protein